MLFLCRVTLHAPRVCWCVQLRSTVDLLGPGVQVLQGWSPPGPAWGLVTRRSYRGAVGSGASLGFQGPREGGPGSLSRAEARGSVVVGVLESSSVSPGAGQSMPSSETLLEEQKWQVGTLPVPGFGPLEEAIVWGAMNKGRGFHSRKDFQFTQKLYLGPLEHRKSHHQQQEPLLSPPRPLAVSPPVRASLPPSTLSAPPLWDVAECANCPKTGNRPLAEGSFLKHPCQPMSEGGPRPCSPAV